MATRATTHLSVSPESVRKLLPHRLRDIVQVGLLGNEPVDLIFFEPGEGHVVSSTDLQKALRKRGQSYGRLITAGYDFTQEARSSIEALNGLIFSERSSWGWTDERWHAVHQ